MRHSTHHAATLKGKKKKCWYSGRRRRREGEEVKRGGLDGGQGGALEKVREDARVGLLTTGAGQKKGQSGPIARFSSGVEEKTMDWHWKDLMRGKGTWSKRSQRGG